MKPGDRAGRAADAATAQRPGLLAPARRRHLWLQHVPGRHGPSEDRWPRRDGVYGPATRAALDRGVSRSSWSAAVPYQINLASQVLTVVENSRIVPSSTPAPAAAEVHQPRSPRRRHHPQRAPSASSCRSIRWSTARSATCGGRNTSPAVSRSTAHPACRATRPARLRPVSNPAMDMIWARGLMPMGRTVVVF